MTHDIGESFVHRTGYRAAIRRRKTEDLGEAFEVICEATDAHAVRLALESASIAVESADMSFLPSVTVPLDDDTGRKVLRLVDALEDSDDVQNVWANFDVSDEVLEAISG